MKVSITKLGLTVLISLAASQSFAGGGQDASVENFAGTYQISGPTNEPGDENTVTFTENGDVYFTQYSGGSEMSCTGKFKIQSGVLYAMGSCLRGYGSHSNFQMSIGLSEVTDSGYFRAPVLCTAIYPKTVQMEFLLN